jgi:Fe-S-cluster containining protein
MNGRKATLSVKKKRAAVAFPLRGNAEPLPVPPAARSVQKKIRADLERLAAGNHDSPLDPEFLKSWRAIAALVDQYQSLIAETSVVRRSCTEGCAACCCHWVEDVNSFEAELLASFVKTRHPQKVSRILDRCRQDETRLKQLNEVVEEKLAAVHGRQDRAGIDSVDLLLAAFYQLRLPCPLLYDGACIAYPVRPLTCRMYVSFSHPSRCDPDYINTGDIPTYLFDLEEEADSLIDKLHFRFLKFENDTGLRSLLLKYLSE